jgi:DNA (cytosine-5)-methyltransferase 1
MKRKFTVVDLFSGVGGLSLGFEQEGMKIVLANDNDPDAAATFKKNHPKVNFHEDQIQTLDKKKLKSILKDTEIDILVGGVPCQSFSMKGPRRTNPTNPDSRDFLFKEFLRITGILKPKVAVIENVTGILSSRNGKIKDTIIEDFLKLGYKVDYKLVNAAEYGVAQLRKRVLFIASRLSGDILFPIPTHSEENFVGVNDVLKDPPTINHDPKKLQGKTLQRVKMIKPGQNWKSLPKELQTGSIHSGSYGRLDPKKPAYTLTTRFDTPPGGYVTHPFEDRAITVREGARIQSFPDDFEFVGKRISQYRQVGNAVPVKLSNALAKSIKKMLIKNEE